MPSDIYVKKDTGWSTAVKNIYARTNSGWSSAIRYVYSRINAGWTRVWPLSGVFPNTNPFISNNTTTTSEISYGTVLRVGNTYKGDRGVWNGNGYTITSYDYKWMAYSAETGGTINYEQSFSTLSTQTNTFTITGTTGANFDKGWITFRVRANASDSAYSGTADSLRYYVVRQKPRLATGGTPTLNITNPKVGDILSYSSSWDITDAYKPEAARSTIVWYKNSANSTTGGTVVQNNGSYSYTVQESDSDNYIYAIETVFNSGSDYELGTSIGVSASVITTSKVSVAPGSFTYSLTNVSSVTTPATPTQQRVSPTSNTVLIEIASSKPSDTDSYNLWSYGTGSVAGGTLANPAVQAVTTLNQYDSSGAISASGTWDTVASISSSASNSPISTFTEAVGTSRTLQFNVSSTTGAQSWAINYTISGASGGNGTYTLNTNTMPRQTIISGATNPTVTINSIKSYAALDQQGGETSGTAGAVTSLSSIPRPTAYSGTSTSNYTYYISYQITGSQRRITLPSAFNSGTTLYVSTNGYINWGGADPGGSTSIPSQSNSGITLAPLSADLRQGSTSSSSNTSPGGLWYYADSSTFVVTYWGNYYTDAAQVARYQVKFYWGQSYADVYFVNNSLTSAVPSTTAIQNNQNIIRTWADSTSQTSTLLSTASMIRVSTNDGIDDDRTVLVASQPVAPSGGTASISGGTAPGTSLTLSKTDATGNPSPSVSWLWRRADGGVGGNSFTGGTVLQNNGTTYQIQNSDVGYSIRAEVTWSNGVSPNQVVTTNSVIATAGTYTVTWNATANGGTGGGTTTQNAGVAHTAPSASKLSFSVSYSSTGQTSGSAPSATQGYFPNTGYYDSQVSNPNQTGPIAVGGSFTPTSSITMYMRYGATSSPVTISNQGTLLRTGYTFGGWNIGGTVYSAGSSYTPTSNVTATAVWNQNAVAPSGGTVSISTNTGNYNVGSIITYSTSGWSGSPTSYYLELHSGTSPVLTSDPLSASTTSTSGTYTIVSGDVGKYFKAWATATNAAGSGTAFSSQVGPAATAFTIPTCAAPSLQFSRKTTSPTHLQWYCDYPTPSGDWSNIQGMQFEIRTTAGGGTLLASGTRSFPGFGTYPYSAGGTVWAFRMGTSDSDIVYSSSARYGRARVVMTGTNGTTYYGTWSGWI